MNHELMFCIFLLKKNDILQNVFKVLRCLVIGKWFQQRTETAELMQTLLLIDTSGKREPFVKPITLQNMNKASYEV